jgi:hypothetical protein
MKILAAFTLLLGLGLAPARAQQPAPPPDDKAQLELLELEQEVDKTLLREAMLLLGRKGLKPASERPTTDEARQRDDRDSHTLEVYIQERKQKMAERSAASKVIRAEANRVRTAVVPRPPAEADRQGFIEKFANAQVEVQLLQAQVEMSQPLLSEAIHALAAAEFAASSDPTQQAKADSARKVYEKAKAKQVELSKRLRIEQGTMGSMQQMMGMNGMGGGFR